MGAEYKTYTIEEFPLAANDNAAHAKVTFNPQVPSLPKDPVDVSRLPVDDKWKNLIEEGKPQGERSEAVWALLGALLHAKVDLGVIVAILTDKRFGVAERALEKGGRDPQGFVWREVQKAMGFYLPRELHELNAKHFVVENYGGKCMVFTEGEDWPQADAAFQRRYGHREVKTVNAKGKETSVKLGKWWLEHPYRRQYSRVEFLPGQDAPRGVYSAWRGWPVTPKEGSCELWLTFVRDVICAQNEEYNEYILNWCAHAVQQPGTPGQVAVALLGGQGCGKSFFANRFGELFKPHFITLAQARHVTGHFNAQLADKLLVFADEANPANDRAAAGVLKSYITEEAIVIERKGVDPINAKRYFRLIFASNEYWAIDVDQDDRRFFVLDVSAARQNDHAYFKAISQEWEQGGREAFMHFLMARDLGEFDHRTRPETHALLRQKLNSLRGMERIAYEWLSSGEAPSKRSDEADRRIFVPSAARKREKQTIPYDRFYSELEKAGGKRGREYVGSGRRGVWLPPLPEARRCYSEATGLTFPGGDEHADWCVPFEDREF